MSNFLFDGSIFESILDLVTWKTWNLGVTYEHHLEAKASLEIE